MRRVAITLLVVGLFAGALVGARALSEPTAAAEHHVVISMQDNRFVPDDIIVAAGTMVMWMNEDHASGEWHNVILENGTHVSDAIPPGSELSLTFDWPGVYVYFCDIHEGMLGRVIVE
jgi:plastocyanin